MEKKTQWPLRPSQFLRSPFPCRAKAYFRGDNIQSHASRSENSRTANKISIILAFPNGMRGAFRQVLGRRLLCVAVHQPNQDWAGHIDRTVGTNDYSQSQTERESMNPFTTCGVENDDHNECRQ